MLVFLKASDRPCSKTFYALVALKILFLNSPGGSLRNRGWGDPHDRKLYRKSVRNISRYETSLHRKKIGGIQKRERSIGVTLYVGSFAAI